MTPAELLMAVILSFMAGLAAGYNGYNRCYTRAAWLASSNRGWLRSALDRAPADVVAVELPCQENPATSA